MDHMLNDVLEKADEQAKTLKESATDRTSSASENIDTNTDHGQLTKMPNDETANLSSIVIENSGENSKGCTIAKTVRIQEPITDKEIRRRARADFNRSTLDRNFITPTRAMYDFLLKPADLENLPRTERRSPYEQDLTISVYSRKDVEKKAIEVWGNRETLLNECLKREINKKIQQNEIFNLKRRLREYRRNMVERKTEGLYNRSGLFIIGAITINTLILIFKVIAWLQTRSHSIFAEMIHSAADTMNQVILAYGIQKSAKKADIHHPYGYTTMKYITALISGVAIFCCGSGLALYQGVDALNKPNSVGDYFWAFLVSGVALVLEGVILMLSLDSIRHNAEKLGMSIQKYVTRGTDPSVNVVLFENTAAILSVLLSSFMIFLSTATGSSIPDAIGALFVGCILTAVAFYIIHTNSHALVGRSIPVEQLERITAELEADVMIRAIHDVKGIDIGSLLVRFKAEMDIDGCELTRFYLEKHDLNGLLAEVQDFNTVDELETFMLDHGESVVDLIGGEIDRIELKLRKKFPEIRHCDLEIL